jgi:type IV pilus assembly protein PilV
VRPRRDRQQRPKKVLAIMNAYKSEQKGSMLLEALIAILIFSFGVLSVVGLQAASVKNISEAKYRTDAAFLANELIGQMWADRANVTVTYAAPADWTARVSSTLPSGVGAVVVSVDPNVTPLLRATVTIKWTLPGAAQHTFVSVAQVNGAGAI